MIDQVFRITFWTRFPNSMWHNKKKNLYDSETDYKRGVKSYKRMVDRRQGGKLIVKATFEEFQDGRWVEIETYPKQSDDED